jgi:IS5 family transposase
MYQSSFLALSHSKKLRCERFLDEMKTVVPWEVFLKEINTYYDEKTVGRKKKDAMLMLKIYFLQQWYALSDPGAEEAVYDRNSFQKFLQIDLLADTVPDETTILNFRHFLEKYELQKKFFTMVKNIMENKGFILKKGTTVDATLIAAPSSTKNKDKKRDPDMSSTKKHGQWYFGMKAHIGTDTDTGVIHSLETTTAKIHDKDKFEDLMHGSEKAKFGDKGYYDEELKRQARKAGIYWGILDKGKRNNPLSASQKKSNRKLSSIRSKVEFPFNVIKCQWHYTKVKYKGLVKNTLNLFTLFSLTNLYMMRKRLIFVGV